MSQIARLDPNEPEHHSELATLGFMRSRSKQTITRLRRRRISSSLFTDRFQQPSAVAKRYPESQKIGIGQLG
jgi:hypothetical protein